MRGRFDSPIKSTVAGPRFRQLLLQNRRIDKLLPILDGQSLRLRIAILSLKRGIDFVAGYQSAFVNAALRHRADTQHPGIPSITAGNSST